MCDSAFSIPSRRNATWGRGMAVLWKDSHDRTHKTTGYVGMHNNTARLNRMRLGVKLSHVHSNTPHVERCKHERLRVLRLQRRHSHGMLCLLLVYNTFLQRWANARRSTCRLCVPKEACTAEFKHLVLPSKRPGERQGAGECQKGRNASMRKAVCMRQSRIEAGCNLWQMGAIPCCNDKC